MRPPEPHSPKRSPEDPSAFRRSLDGLSGPRYVRGLEQLSESEEFLRYLHREFPEQADQWTDPASRRDFLKLMAGSLALAGLSGCAFQPPERIVPYVKAPEELVQGRPLFFATSMELGGSCVGLLAESHEGRPTKLEGNALHPACPPAFSTRRVVDGEEVLEDSAAGASDIFAQAELLTLYDPDRSQALLRNARPSTWEDFQEAMLAQHRRRKGTGGRGLRLLTPAITSPTLAAQIRGLLDELPEARWHQYEPVHRDAARAGAIRALGRDAQPVYHLDRADVILALDADFLARGPGHLVLARDFGDRRDPESGGLMNRLYAVECTPTITGSKADHRLPLAASRIKDFALALARELGVEGVPAPSADLPEEARRWIEPLAEDLRDPLRDLREGDERGRSLVIAGHGQPPVVHALALAMNEALGNVGETVESIEPVLAEPVDQTESIRELVAAMRAGEVDMLVMLGVNPVYDAPVDLQFRDALLARDEAGNRRIPLRVHLGLYRDETGELCTWHVPMAHLLESWGDGRAFDGTATLRQPLIAPLFGGKTMLQVVAALRGVRDPDPRALLEEHWRAHFSERGASEDELDDLWEQAVHDGLVAGTASEPLDVPAQPGADLLGEGEGGENGDGSTVELVFAPDPTVFDGRYANNAWLQECPKPLTKLTWDNALMVPPSMVAEGGRLAGRKNGDVVNLTIGTVTYDEALNEQVRGVAIWVMPGHAEDAVTLHLGYGRSRSGRIGDGLGFNAYAIRRSDTPWILPGVTLGATDRQYTLVSTQLQRSIEGRDIVLEDTFRGYREAEHHEGGEGHHGNYGSEAGPGEVPPSLYPTYDYSEDRDGLYKGRDSEAYRDGWNNYPGYAWGMSVDLSRCIGCAACVVACQAENNIPVVGKEEVRRGRIMHWMEVDRYYAIGAHEGEEADLANPDVAFQPRFCMHCEKAPCEPVCPVAATVHDHEGLNNMVYNRCVGTRYCSNNCPYKVRHFNFLNYSEIRLKATATSTEVSPLTLLHNPDVTIRTRGVMEKCTYCVQRIYEGKIQAELEDRRVRDGEILTACQSACPTRALVFGDLNDETSEVVREKEAPRMYGMLAHELNTRPRTTYLKRLTNPNPRLTTPEPV